MIEQKNYIVSITAIRTNRTIKINITAINKKEALDSIKDVIIKCDFFGYKTLNDFVLTAKIMRRDKFE
ncbi:hypothetical protein [Anaerofustis butyriciformans]|uniref:hypothetical protein n=1 Tax=Anaerofustis butyriciformans TaxID=3108533 RepID=UPI002E3444D9|nr:hypothetical protein [Anaerofustis sp. HA2171]